MPYEVISTHPTMPDAVFETWAEAVDYALKMIEETCSEEQRAEKYLAGRINRWRELRDKPSNHLLMRGQAEYARAG